MANFRQLEQRHVSTEIALMEWNPTLDLIALASCTGEVTIHRLSWQKVWSIASTGTKEKPVLVTAMAWRPDGKILAYAYDNGKVTICDVENYHSVHMVDVHCIVTALDWVPCTIKTESGQRPLYTDRSSEFLQKSNFAFNKTYASNSKQYEEVADDFKRMKGQKELNILTIGMEIGMVHFHSFGMFPSGWIDVNLLKDKQQDKVISVSLSNDFKMLSAILETKDVEGNYSFYYRSFHISLLHDCMEEFKIVSLKYGQISSLLTYLSSTIRAISEAWEDILLEFDTKLHNYATQKAKTSDGSISDDFLELLMFGNPSDPLEKFLLHDLTESGLKKFGHSIELSYSIIQKLVLKRLQYVSSSLFYHLNDFKGMALWKERFGPLGMDATAIHRAELFMGSFLLKATEIQQVIDSSMKNFKSFFRWLYSVILRLSDEPIPADISKLTEQDLHFVAEFLKENFTFECDENKKMTVRLERVAQYLKKEDLQYPASTSGNPWVKFLQEHPSLKDTGYIFPHYPEKSLVTLYAELRKQIDQALKGPWSVLKDTTRPGVTHLLKKTGKIPHMLSTSHMTCSESGHIYTIVLDETTSPNFYLLREKSTGGNDLEAMGFTFKILNTASSSSGAPESYKILDAKFYNRETITVMLVEDFLGDHNCPILVQLSLRFMCSEMRPVSLKEGESLIGSIPICDAAPFIDKNHLKRLDNVKARGIAVSGSRKVICVLFASRRQVRLFEMEAEEEEDEEETEHEDSMMKDVSKESIICDEESDDVKQEIVEEL